MHDYRKLEVWQSAIDLATKIYRLTSKFPDSERYNLTAQIRRCAVSIPSNIAEGAGRNSSGEFCQFLGIALGSCNELETQLIIAQNIGHLNAEVIQPVIEETHSIQRRMYNLRSSIR